MAYIKWHCSELGRCSEELREAASRMSGLLDSLGDAAGRLDAQIADSDGLGYALRDIIAAAADDCDRLRRERAALEDAAAVYSAAEREALRRSEELPAGIAERGLLVEDWFADIIAAPR
jgi:hypothetical protein